MGIVSIGIGCNSTIDGNHGGSSSDLILYFSGEKIPGVYGRVSTVVDWISHHISDGGTCATPASEQAVTVRTKKIVPDTG